MELDKLPILYSLHNCPYAIRARLAIVKAQQPVRLRSIKLDNKPADMLLASPKGSVPVLVLTNSMFAKSEHQESETSQHVIDESLDVMLWALKRHDPDNLLRAENSDDLAAMCTVIEAFEREFIPAMNAFSCAKRYHEDNMLQLRQECEYHLAKLEQQLNQHSYLFAQQESLVDLAIVPFLRKFARIDKQWFRSAPFPKLQAWLNHYLTSLLFSKTMESHELWLESKKDVCFGQVDLKKG